VIETLIGLATVTYLFARAFRVAATGLAQLDRLWLGRKALSRTSPDQLPATVEALAKWQVDAKPKRK
jgi:hypothetical protein